MGRIMTFLIIAYLIFMIIRVALRYFIHDKEQPKHFNRKKPEGYDKNKAVDATFEEIK